MVKITGKYKCEHNWTTVFIKGATKQEIKIEKNKRKNEVCPKCKQWEKDVKEMI